MRRKSERVKDKDKSTEKKADKSPKKSRRSSRRRKKSSSTSPEEESETDDYDVSFKSCKDEIEEEHSTSRNVSGKNTAEIDTATPVLATEVEGKESPHVSGSRTRRSSKKQLEEVEEKPTPEDHANEIQEKVEGADDDVGESLDKHKESESKSSVWQVKSADCSGGEIKKLKLCIVRPQEPTEPEPRKRKKLSRMPHRETESNTGESEELTAHDSPEEKRKSRKSASNVLEDSRSGNKKRHGSGSRKTRTDDSSDDEQRQIDSSGDLLTATEVLVDKEQVQEEEENNSSQGVNLRGKPEAADSTKENEESNTVEESVTDNNNIVESVRSPEQAKSAASPDPFDKLKEAEPSEHVSTEADVKPSSVAEKSENCPVSLKVTNVDNNTESNVDNNTESNVKEVSKPSNSSEETVHVTTSNLLQEGPKPSNSSEETEHDTTSNLLQEGPKPSNSSEETEHDRPTTSNLLQEGSKPSSSSEETANVNSPSEKIPEAPDSSEKIEEVSDLVALCEKAQDTPESMPKCQESPPEKGDDCTETKSQTRDSLKDSQDTSECKTTTDNSSEQVVIESSKTPLKKSVSHESSDSEEERLNYRKAHESKKIVHRLTRHKSDTRPIALDTSEKTCETKAPFKSSTFNVETTSIKSRDLQNSSKSTSKHMGRPTSDDTKSKEVIRDPPRLERKKYKGADNDESVKGTEKPRVREKISLKRSSSRVNDDNISRHIAMTGEGVDVQGDKQDGSTPILDNLPIGSEPQPNLIRKRKWGTSKSTIAAKKPTLSISSDSLKHLIPEVKPLPISEVQLTEDEDEEEEEGEVLDKVEESFEIDAEMNVETQREESQSNNHADVKEPLFPLPMVADPPEGKSGPVRKISIISADAARLQRSPSPARHRASSVLFVTNLVRPFTVNQLRELLARTGSIVDNGFWIDKIKSKCYVQYETETEAQETRHALHGVRWPVSNPKQLSVDYAKKEDMDLARDLAEGNHIPRKTEPLKMDRMDGWLADQGRDKEREHINVVLRDDRERVRGKERHVMGPMELMEKSREAKMAVSIREWDLGKMDVGSFDERGFHREERSAGERERRIRKERSHRSPSLEPPGRKIRKKDEEAPAKLLDDLFKKTKVTPCVYWLPLTADQIVVKEEMRRKHMAEHERRMAEMRKAEKAERERQRARMQGRTSQRRFDDRERDKRRHRSPSGSPKK